MEFKVCKNCMDDGTAREVVFFSNADRVEAYKKILLQETLGLHKMFCTSFPETKIREAVLYLLNHDENMQDELRLLHQQLFKAIDVDILKEYNQSPELFAGRYGMIEGFDFKDELAGVVHDTVYSSDDILHRHFQDAEECSGNAKSLCVFCMHRDV